MLFGRVIDALNNNPGDQRAFQQGVDVICVAFVAMGAISLVAGVVEVHCWSVAGERQTHKFRRRYVDAILSQEVGWFDTEGAGQLVTRVNELTGKIQDGLGRKAADVVQNLTQFVFGFIVAFYLCARLTAVLLAVTPLIGFAGSFLVNAVTAAQNQALEQYSAAGATAAEALGAVRTVTALNAQPEVIGRYNGYLELAKRIGIVKGVKVGFAQGFLFFCLLGTFALGFWYGAQLVARSIDQGCTQHGDCLTGGTVLSTFFAVMMGSTALGQVAPPMTSFFEAKAAIRPIMDVINRKPLIDGLSEEGRVLDKATGAHNAHSAYSLFLKGV